MWIFGKDRTAFPYEVDATSDEAAGDWVLRPCKHTKTGAPYTAWVLSGSLERARAVVKRMKTLRHPNFVTYVDSHEGSDSLTLITEPATPLGTYLRRNADSCNLTYLSSWGIYQVTKALAFFNKDCKLHHNNVRLSSVFVTPAGDWKLAGLELVQPADTAADAPVDASVFWPPDKRRVDSWGLGCLIWEVYNADRLRNADQLRQLNAIPGALVPQYSELLHPKGARRATVNDFLTRASAQGGFFDNFYVRSLLFLEEIQIKDKEEKLEFLAGLADDVAVFPDDVAKFKLLPHLMHFLQYGGAGAEVLTPLLRLGKLLDGTEFEQKVLPCLVKLFSSPDRATRVRLLEQLPNFVDNLPQKCVNDQIFQPVCQGFSDTNPLVREATIRAMVPLAGKLSDRTLNEALPRHLTQLQVKDEQGGIRANATICLAKLASRMSARVRQGPLLNAFLKCTRDPYPPARRMAVVALATTLPCYTLKDSAGKVMPCLAFLTVDPEREVRDETFRALHAVVGRLEKASSDPEMAEREDKAANSGGASDMGSAGMMASSAASAGTAALAWTNWAVSALSSKFMKGGAEKASTAAATSTASSVAKEETEEKTKKEKKVEKLEDLAGIKSSDFLPEHSYRKPASTYNWDGASTDKAEGWDDFDVEDDEEDGWGSLEAPGKAASDASSKKRDSPLGFGEAKSRDSPVGFGEAKSRDSPVGFGEAKSRDSPVGFGEAKVGGKSGIGSRGAMKLGKKAGGLGGRGVKEKSEGLETGSDWNSWSGTGKADEGTRRGSGEKQKKEKKEDDWNSWSGVGKAEEGTRRGSGEKQKKEKKEDDWKSWSGVGKTEKGTSHGKKEEEGDWNSWGAEENASSAEWNSWGGRKNQKRNGGSQKSGGWDAW